MEVEEPSGGPVLNRKRSRQPYEIGVKYGREDVPGSKIYIPVNPDAENLGKIHVGVIAAKEHIWKAMQIQYLLRMVGDITVVPNSFSFDGF